MFFMDETNEKIFMTVLQKIIDFNDQTEQH